MSAIFSETGSCTAVSACPAGGLESPQFVPRPPSVDFVCRKRPTTPTRTERVSSQTVADTCVDNDRGCISGRSRGGGGENGAGAVQADVPTEKATREGEEQVRKKPSSPPIEAADGTKRRPPTLETEDKEKPGEARCEDIVVVPSLTGGRVEVNPPRRAPRPAFDPRPEVPGTTTAASFAGDDTRGCREEDPAGSIENDATIVGGAEPATGKSSGSSMAAAVPSARPGYITDEKFDKVGLTVDRNQKADRGDRPSPLYGTTAVGEPPSAGSNSNGQSNPHAPTGDAARELMSSRNTRESSRHEQEPDLKTSSTIPGTASDELGGDLVSKLERLRVVRLTAMAVSDTIFSDAVATAIAAQSRAARYSPSGSGVCDVLETKS